MDYRPIGGYCQFAVMPPVISMRPVCLPIVRATGMLLNGMAVRGANWADRMVWQQMAIYFPFVAMTQEIFMRQAALPTVMETAMLPNITEAPGANWAD